jgi:hypothetical protein
VGYEEGAAKWKMEKKEPLKSHQTTKHSDLNKCALRASGLEVGPHPQDSLCNASRPGVAMRFLEKQAI